MVPGRSDGWTYETVKALCAAGQSESDRHDFKGGLPDPQNLTKICCAFANTYGGFVIVGVGEGPNFEIRGLDPDKELYGRFLQRVKADPEIAISTPETILVPGLARLLYVFEIPQSPRRPHLPTPADQRIFWKRQGSNCVQMTLEEIRYQMNSYEEKREKLALLLIDLDHKVQSLSEQGAAPDGSYTGEIFSFEIVDRVVVEAYALLKDNVEVFRVLDDIKKSLMLLNSEKRKMMSILAMSYGADYKTATVNAYRDLARRTAPQIASLADKIESFIAGKYEVVNPYRAHAKTS